MGRYPQELGVSGALEKHSTPLSRALVVFHCYLPRYKKCCLMETPKDLPFSKRSTVVVASLVKFIEHRKLRK